MINLYGNVNSKQKNHIIYTNYDILRDKPFNSNALAKIISEFYKVLLGKVKNFLLKENYKSYGVVLSSFEYKIEGIEEMAKSFLNTVRVFEYTPETYVELNDKCIPTIGVVKLQSRLDSILGIKYNSIVQTNPNTIEGLNIKSKKTPKLFALLQRVIGERNEWKQ